MTGGIVYRLLRYAIAGAVALTLGTRFLSAVAWAVIPWNLGNPYPVLVVAGASLALMYLAGLSSPESPQGMIISVFAWIAAGYLGVVLFFLTLPMGLLIALFTGVFTIMGLSVIMDDKVKASVRRALDELRSLIFRGIGKSVQSDRIGFTLQTQPIDNIIRLVSEQPRLPIALTRYEEVTVLLTEAASSKLVLDFLDEYGIPKPEPCPQLLLWAILNLPLIDKRSGLMIDNYVIIEDEAAVKRILQRWPVRASLFPSPSGPILVLRKEDSMGFLVTQIDRGHRMDIIVHRNPISLWNYLDGGVTTWA